MEYAIGAGVAAGWAVFSTLAGFDRERVYYPVVLVVVATYYLLFAVMGGSTGALWAEAAGAAVFTALAVVGFRTSLWIVAAGLVGHGVFDFVHGAIIGNPGVPPWWPGFCMAFDVAAGAYLAWRLSPYGAGRRLPDRARAAL
jgi:hypothetical protein